MQPLTFNFQDKTEVIEAGGGIQPYIPQSRAESFHGSLDIIGEDEESDQPLRGEVDQSDNGEGVGIGFYDIVLTLNKL